MQHQRPSNRATLCSLLLTSAVAFAGCNSASSEVETGDHAHGHEHDHDHGHRPDSLHEAVEQLTVIRREISTAIESGDAEAAHGPLHEVAELLEAIPDIAAETDLPKQEWEAVKAAADRLFEAYGIIDKAFHVDDGDKQAAYEQVAGELAEALEEIRSRLPLAGEEPPAAGHDEDHDHDHDGHGHDHDEPGHEHDT